MPEPCSPGTLRAETAPTQKNQHQIFLPAQKTLKLTLLSCNSMSTSWSLLTPPWTCQLTVGFFFSTKFVKITSPLPVLLKPMLSCKQSEKLTVFFCLGSESGQWKSLPPYMCQITVISHRVYLSIGLGKCLGGLRRSVLPTGIEKWFSMMRSGSSVSHRISGSPFFG